MDFGLEEVFKIRGFIDELNSKADSVVIVEGKRDAEALKRLGLTKHVLEFHKFGGIAKFADSVSRHKKLIIMLDSDRKGRYLTRRIIEQLSRRTKLDLSQKKRLIEITSGKIRTIEELILYEPYVNNNITLSYDQPVCPKQKSKFT